MSQSAPKAPPGVVAIQAEIDRLRAAFPGWKFEYVDSKAAPWLAIREHNPEWVGGHSVCEAKNPEHLRGLIGSAVELNVTGAESAARCTR